MRSARIQRLINVRVRSGDVCGMKSIQYLLTMINITVEKGPKATRGLKGECLNCIPVAGELMGFGGKEFSNFCPLIDNIDS